LVFVISLPYQTHWECYEQEKRLFQVAEKVFTRNRLSVFAGCAGTPNPVLYPNNHLQQVGRAAAGAAAGMVRGAMQSGETSPVYKTLCRNACVTADTR